MTSTFKSFYSIVLDQVAWSRQTLGKNVSKSGTLEHIRKECDEVESENDTLAELYEWIDIIILGMDGAWRCATRYCDQISAPALVAEILQEKMRINRKRTWPKLEDIKEGKPIEHIKETQSEITDKDGKLIWWV